MEFEAKKPKDLTRINSNDFCELLWWSYILGVSPERLLSATEQVGNVTEKVRKHIKNPDQ